MSRTVKRYQSDFYQKILITPEQVFKQSFTFLDLEAFPPISAEFLNPNALFLLILARHAPVGDGEGDGDGEGEE